jgi:diguanylate cyclase
MSEVGSSVISGSFAEACDRVLDQLKRDVPLDTWDITRYDGTDQVCLFVRSDSGLFNVGDTWAWDGSMCKLVRDGKAPPVVPDVAADPTLAGRLAGARVHPGAHVGMPITRARGDLFGMICGVDTAPRPELRAHEGMLRLVASLLGTILDEDMARSEVARRLERAEMLADTDQLTGLYNRRGWQNYIDHEEERLRRYGDPAGIIVVDLDHLKAVNDRLGHAAGDRLLDRTAATIRATVRGSDVAARLGGDEFGIIAPHSNALDVAALAARLRQAFANAGINASVGHAGYTINAGFAGTWEAADAAMYAEKRRRQQHRRAG